MGSLNRVRQQLVHGSHWYLPAIGVDPAYQGRGIGGALLRPMLTRADRENRPCYLETFRERNTAFYRRYGFVSLTAEVHAESGLPFWGMRRDPRP
jgi:ribosomal protein S18 acetylase RimI-like enzyme